MSNFNSADIAAFKDVWVFCEQREGKLMPTDFELISKGRDLADELGVNLCGLLLGLIGVVVVRLRLLLVVCGCLLLGGGVVEVLFGGVQCGCGGVGLGLLLGGLLGGASGLGGLGVGLDPLGQQLVGGLVVHTRGVLGFQR